MDAARTRFSLASDEPATCVGYAHVMKYLRRFKQATDRHPDAMDLGLMTLLTSLLLLTIRIGWHEQDQLSGAWAVLLSLLLMVPLAWRRRFPLGVLVVMTPALVLFQHEHVPESLWSMNGWWLALYGAGAYGRTGLRDYVRAAAVAALSTWILHDLFFTDFSGFEGDLSLLRIVTVLSFSRSFGPLGIRFASGGSGRSRSRTEPRSWRRNVKRMHGGP